MKLSNLNSIVTPTNIDPTYLTNLVNEITVGTATNQITFDNLDGNNDEGYILFCEINNSLGGTADDVCLYVNNDLTNGNYTESFLGSFGTTDAVQCGHLSYPSIGWVAANQSAIQNVQIATPAGYFMADSNTTEFYSTSSQGYKRTVRKTATITNITRLDIKSYAGNNVFGVGSKFKLYRRKLNPALVLSNRYLSNLVEEIHVSADTSSITFSNLDSGLDGDYILTGGYFGTTTAIDKSVVLSINNDSVADNYYGINHYGYYNSGISHGVSVTYANTLAYFNNTYPAMFEVSFKVIAGKVIVQGYTSRGLDANQSCDVSDIVTRYKPTVTTINSISLTFQENIAAGSTFRLYKSNGAQRRLLVPTDLSNATSDYKLGVGETAYLNYTNATSVPLHIQTEEGEYEITVTGHNMTLPADNYNFLNINNTTYDNIVEERIYVNSDSNFGVSNATNNTGIRFSSGLCRRATIKINTHTLVKSYETVCMRGAASPTFGLYHILGFWNEFTTPWTSLGTITFGTAQSGKIIIKRII